PKVKDRIVTATTLNIRSHPNTKSSIIGKYKKGDVVKVSFVENGWAGILIEGRVYFVSADYLTQKQVTYNNEPTKTKNSSSLYVIKSGDTFTKIGKALGISVSSLQELNPTVDSSKLKIGQKIKIPTTTAVFQARTMYVTASSLRVRESASTSSAVLG